MQHPDVADTPPTGPPAAATPTIADVDAGSAAATQGPKDISTEDGQRTPSALVVRPGGSWGVTLQGHEQVVQTSAVLSEFLQVCVDQAEALLISEARRRGIPTPVLAQEALQHPEEATQWGLARCSVCGAAGLLRAFGDYKLLRVLVCPQGHGVICRS